jgi:hypothetical protein
MEIQPCNCAICGELLASTLAPSDLADFDVYKCGELQYTELAHRACAVADDSGVAWDYDSHAPEGGDWSDADEDRWAADDRLEMFRNEH